jgi:hypothetical protein
VYKGIIEDPHFGQLGGLEIIRQELHWKMVKQCHIGLKKE